MSVVAEDGTAVGCEVTGEGPPLVLVHGAASDARQWARVVPLLAPRLRVVAMDRRGRRRSGPIGPGHGLEVEGGDIAAVVTASGEPAHLLGHSSGARFALLAALRIPRLASLVLYEPPPPETFAAGVLDTLRRLEAAGDRVGILRLFLIEILGNDEDAFAFIQERPIWPIMLENALTLPAEMEASSHHRLDRAALAELHVPVLLLVGELSGPDTRAAVDEVADALPDARVAVLPGQGHGAMLSAPTLFAAEVRRFVESAGATRA